MRRIKFIAIGLLVVALALMTRSVLNDALGLKEDDSYFTVQLAEATRLEKELLQFRVDVAALVNGIGNVTAGDVRMSFDLLWSRSHTEADRPRDPRIKAVNAYRGDLKKLAEQIEAVDPLVAALHPGDEKGLAEIERVLSASQAAMSALNKSAYAELYQTSADTAVKQRGVLHRLDLMQRAMLSVGLFAFILLLFELRNGEKLNRELKDREAEIRALAGSDPLTGLANRRKFDELMLRIDAGLFNDSCHLLMIDLDGFKAINDSNGHEAGDHVLVETARRLSQVVPAARSIARLGGDEFAVLLSGSLNHAVDIADAMLKVLALPIYFQDRPLSIGVSIGIAARKSGPNTSLALKREADGALYEAKTGGRNRAVVWGAEGLSTVPVAAA